MIDKCAINSWFIICNRRYHGFRRQPNAVCLISNSVLTKTHFVCSLIWTVTVYCSIRRLIGRSVATAPKLPVQDLDSAIPCSRCCWPVSIFLPCLPTLKICVTSRQRLLVLSTKSSARIFSATCTNPTNTL